MPESGRLVLGACGYRPSVGPLRFGRRGGSGLSRVASAGGPGVGGGIDRGYFRPTGRGGLTCPHFLLHGDVVEVLAALGGRPVTELRGRGLHPDQVVGMGDQESHPADLDRHRASTEILIARRCASGLLDSEHVKVAVAGMHQEVPAVVQRLGITEVETEQGSVHHTQPRAAEQQPPSERFLMR